MVDLTDTQDITARARVDAARLHMAGMPVAEVYDTLPNTNLAEAAQKWIAPPQYVNQQGFRSNGAMEESLLNLHGMVDGAEITIEGPMRCFAGYDRTFEGVSHNQVDILGSARIRRSKGVMSIWPAHRTKLEYTTINEPIMGVHIACNGQSQSVRLALNGGVAGIEYAMRQGTGLDAPVIDDFYFTNGGTGSTSISRRSQNNLSSTNYHVDDTDPDPANWVAGPAGITFSDAIAESAARGQNAASLMLFRQGEGEADALEDGTITVAEYVEVIEWYFDYCRTVIGNPTLPIIVGMLGSWEIKSNLRGGSMVREAYQTVAANDANVHIGTEMYDLPRAIGEVHLNLQGYYALGIREAAVIANVLYGQSNDLGPQIQSVNLGATPTTGVVRFTGSVEMAGGHPVDDWMPGPYPYGIMVVPAGETIETMTTPIQLDGAEINNDGGTLTIHSPTDLTGTTLVPVAGQFADWAQARFIRNDFVHGCSQGLPLRSIPFTIT